jgi:hypothetical protein
LGFLSTGPISARVSSVEVKSGYVNRGAGYEAFQKFWCDVESGSGEAESNGSEDQLSLWR